MTGPSIYDQAASGGSIDWLSQMGPQSQMFRDEQQMFNSGRDQLLNQIMGVRQAAQMQTQQAAARTNPQSWHDEDLVGAAMYWGIPEAQARATPRDQLISMVNQFRNQVRPADVQGAQVASTLAPLAQFGVGAAEAITGGIEKLPIIGEAARNSQWLHGADMYLRGLEEGVRSSTPESMQGVESGANIAGNLAAMWVPGNAAWNMAGVVGKVVPFGMLGGVLGPIARAGFQGGASLALLTGGSDEFKENPGKSLAEGAAFGAGVGVLGSVAEHFAPQINALANKVTNAFVTVPQDILQSGDLSGGGDFGAPMNAPATELTGAQPPQAPSSLDQLRQLAQGGDEQATAIMNAMNAPRPQPAGLDPDALAAQMNKAGNIVQSPAFPDIAKSTLIDETSAADAVIATNPGGTNLVQGISDPATFVQKLGDNVRFAQRGVRLDAMISDHPITDEMVGQYEATGLYQGQKVLVQDGTAATITRAEPGYSWVQPMYHDIPWRVDNSQLHPWTTSPGSVEVPQMWDHFNSYVQQRVDATTEAMGGALSPAQVTTVRAQNLPSYLEDYLDVAGVKDPADRARVKQYFNIRYVTDYKALAPMESAIQDGMVQDAHDVIDSSPPKTPMGKADQAGAMKGFVVVPEGTTGKVSVVESTGLGNGIPGTSGRSVVSFNSVEDAHDWVRKLNRDVPDITPPSDVPVELQAQHLQEPTQGPNLTVQTPPLTVRSIQEMEDQNVAAGLGGGSANVPPAQIAAASGNTGRLKNLWTDGFLKWQPARRMFSKIDQGLYAITGNDFGVAKMYDDISNAVVMHHNDQHPWMDRATDIMKPVKTSRLVDGSFTRIYELEDDGARMAAMKAAGFSSDEMTSMDQTHEFFKDMFAETGLDANREIKRYVSHIGQRQSVPEMVGQAYEDFPLTPVTKPFYEYARTDNLNAREMDMRELMNTYTRAVTWQKNMSEPFNAALSYTKQLQDHPQAGPAGQLMENWLKIVRYGYHANDDLALDAMHGVLRAALGPEVTRQQARELFNFGLNATHSGLLGFRLNVMARDAQQFWLAVPRAGGHLLNAIKDYSTSAEARTKIWQDALDAGAIALQSPRMVAPGDFAGELEAQGAGTSQATGIRMRALGQVTNAIRDILPDWMQNTKDSFWHPMYLYGKQSELMRALTFTGGRDKAAEALATYRAGGSVDLPGLMGDSGARTYDPSWQRQFKQLVASGNDADAANFMGRQLADATQFKYGTTETAYSSKSMTGRLALQFGNYSMQYYQFMRESLVNGTPADKAKLLMLAGGMTAAIEAASEKTGWNFRYMNPWFGLGFTGGPWLGLMTSMASGVNSAMQLAQGNDVTPGALQSLAGMTSSLGQAGAMLNPVAGLMKTAQGLGAASESPYPGLATARGLITGNWSNTPDVNLAMQPQMHEELMRSLGPISNPVRAGAYGTTQITPQVPVYPVDIGGTGVGAPADTSAIPFGQPSGNTPSVYQITDVESALRGDQRARAMFTPDEVHVLDSLQGMPHDIALQAFRSYMTQKTNGSPDMQYNTGASTSGQVPPQPALRGMSHPGGGMMF